MLPLIQSLWHAYRRAALLCQRCGGFTLNSIRRVLLPKRSELRACQASLIGWHSGEPQWLVFHCLLQISALSFLSLKTCRLGKIMDLSGGTLQSFDQVLSIAMTLTAGHSVCAT